MNQNNDIERVNRETFSVMTNTLVPSAYFLVCLCPESVNKVIDPKSVIQSIDIKFIPTCY